MRLDKSKQMIVDHISRGYGSELFALATSFRTQVDIYKLTLKRDIYGPIATNIDLLWVFVDVKPHCSCFIPTAAACVATPVHTQYLP